MYLDNTFVDIYCSAIKNASNKMGYYPQFFFNLLEPFTGISEPAVLCSWLVSCGFRETIEAFEVEKSDSPLQWYHEYLSTNGVYSNVHKQFATKDESIKAAITEGQIKELIMLLSPSLLRIIQKQNSEDNKTEEILNIPINHYVVAKEISLTDSNNVSLVIWTYGIEYKAEIPYSDFLNGYHGFLATRPPAILAIECNANNVLPCF